MNPVIHQLVCLIIPPKPPCYKARFQMHRDNKILVNCSTQERLAAFLIRPLFHCRRGAPITGQLLLNSKMTGATSRAGFVLLNI